MKLIQNLDLEKENKMKKTINVLTHSGVFHSDETTAIALLKVFLNVKAEENCFPLKKWTSFTQMASLVLQKI